MKSIEPLNISILGLAKNKRFRLHLALFIVVNTALYFWMFVGHGLVNFNRHNYVVNSHHYTDDLRIQNPNGFSLNESLAQFDAQWYLRIADRGYPSELGAPAHDTKPAEGSPTYAYPPLYSMLIWLVNSAVNSLLLSAFLVTQLTLVGAFWVTYWLVLRWFSTALSEKTAWLVFLYPFSIFYRGYFSEGLFLILLVIFLDAILSKKPVTAALSAGLLSVTRLLGLSAVLLLAIKTTFEYSVGKLHLRKFMMIVALAITPIALFASFNSVKTGDAFFFAKIRSAWFEDQMPIFSSLDSLVNFFYLPLHSFHNSKIDVISIVVFGLLLLFSRKWLPRMWWWMAFIIWFIPLITGDTTSASRYQIINLPLFIYAAHRLNGISYKLVLACSLVGLLVTSLLFVNWYWLG